MNFLIPSPDELDKAEDHAKHISDSWILEKIQECRAYYAKVESTSTIKLPKSTPEAECSTEEIAGKVRRQRTLPTPIEFPAKTERLDWELEQFLADFEEMVAGFIDRFPDSILESEGLPAYLS